MGMFPLRLTAEGVGENWRLRSTPGFHQTVQRNLYYFTPKIRVPLRPGRATVARTA